MAGLLENKVVLVTGGGSGIGRATSLLLAKQGAKVMIADYVPESAERTVKLIKDAGGNANCIAADVSIPKQVEAMVAKTVEVYGRLVGAFNNAGIEGKMADTVEYPEETFDRIMAINLKGVWLCMRAEIPQMLKTGGGAIVNTASGSGAGRGPDAFRLQRLQAWRGRPHQNRRARICAEEYSGELRLPGPEHADGRADDWLRRYERAGVCRSGASGSDGSSRGDR